MKTFGSLRLDDLMDFIRQYVRNNATSSPQKDIYYCLQSITVVPDKNDSEHFFVVDGQQRLTTIYILLHFLRNKEEWNYPIYTLSMPKRDVQHTYINELDFKDPNYCCPIKIKSSYKACLDR